MNSVMIQKPAFHHALLNAKEGFGIRQNHLAVNNATPDSPRPQKTPSSDNGATLIIPTPPKNNQSSKSRS
ncbi:hypothetical protein M3Y97_00561100 [Aphelenchoides bicaudatus]|nr:hypothetical protein M3Y97_00561100 [Aphelenchoides bicaudatus]